MIQFNPLLTQQFCDIQITKRLRDSKTFLTSSLQIQLSASSQ